MWIYMCLYTYPSTKLMCMCVQVYTYPSGVWLFILFYFIFFVVVFMAKYHGTFQITPTWGKSRVSMIMTNNSLPHASCGNSSPPRRTRERVRSPVGIPGICHLCCFLSQRCQQQQLCLWFFPGSCCLPSVSPWPKHVRQRMLFAPGCCL